MTRLLLIALLMLSHGPVYAEWVERDRNAGKGTTVYVDQDLIHRNGNLVKMWELTDYKSAQTFDADTRYLSEMRQREYDCAEERWRMLALAFFSGQMGNGTTVYSRAYKNLWAPVFPGSIGRRAWKIACDKQ